MPAVQTGRCARYGSLTCVTPTSTLPIGEASHELLGLLLLLQYAERFQSRDLVGGVAGVAQHHLRMLASSSTGTVPYHNDPAKKQQPRTSGQQHPLPVKGAQNED